MGNLFPKHFFHVYAFVMHLFFCDFQFLMTGFEVEKATLSIFYKQHSKFPTRL